MTGECELHDVEFDKCSVCPVCEAVYFEQERIIKLLERPENRDEWIYATRNTVGTYGNTVEFLIALIKGKEN